jgi:hypothetical protein
MEFVFNLLGSQSVIGIVQMFLGKWLKENPKFPNAAINFMTFLAAVLGYSVLPATASAAALLTPFAPGLSIIGMAIFQNLLITGTHSTFKNTLFPALKIGLAWLNGTINKV